ncbi:MAG: peptidoglycan DD-metalloendopeptidase family protein [Alphaproteobacteria bacterium]
MWRLFGPLLLAAIVSGCGFAGVNPRSSGSAQGQFGHQVAAGESIYSIADRYGTTPEAVAARNSLQPPYQLTIGQRLVLPAPSSYVVQPGETMDLIARRYGITPSELARVNGIGAPYTVTPGQSLSIPQGVGTTALAAVPAASGPVQVSELPPPGAPQALSSAVGTVGPVGPALPAAVPPVGAAATGAPVPLTGPQAPTTPPVAGTQQVYTLLPPGDPNTPVSQTLPPAAPAAATEPVAPAPTDTATASTGATSASASGSAGGGLPALSGSGFLKPVSGQVLSGFGDGSPIPNDGVNIAAPRGTPIQASESGVVAYVGEDIDTFGNLVLVRHADGWVTAYGHADAILVSEGDVITRGQVIARVGSTGAVTVPQLHFELRRGTQPVDPMAYLEG